MFFILFSCSSLVHFYALESNVQFPKLISRLVKSCRHGPIGINMILFSRPASQLDFIDHVVGNQPDLQMESVAQWYVSKDNYYCLLSTGVGIINGISTFEHVFSMYFLHLSSGVLWMNAKFL